MSAVEPTEHERVELAVERPHARGCSGCVRRRRGPNDRHGGLFFPRDSRLFSSRFCNSRLCRPIELTRARFEFGVEFQVFDATELIRAESRVDLWCCLRFTQLIE